MKYENWIITRAAEILREAYGPEAKFRPGQLEAIVNVVAGRRTLVVQKTGWGKSLVYFIAARILREQDSGPAVIISPLLALMANQVESSKAFGITTRTINSDQSSFDNEEITQLIQEEDSIDVLIISPERLANPRFDEWFSQIPNLELFVVDEAHCISQWGHDFRPDYQRIKRQIDSFSARTAVLATTATANDKVIEDIRAQLGQDLLILRGPLMRKNLSIQIEPEMSREERLAWLVEMFSKKPKSQGLIYCHTTGNCDMIAGLLRSIGIEAESYHGKKLDPPKILREFEEENIQVLVTTSKLGMGYDNLSIRFVIHFQMPENMIAYYQQIGRAGRDGVESFIFLLHGPEDRRILEHFATNSLIPANKLEELLESFPYDGRGLTTKEMERRVNLPVEKIKFALKYLEIRALIYHERVPKSSTNKSAVTQYFRNFSIPFDRRAEEVLQRSIIHQRQNEMNKMERFCKSQRCYMQQLGEELNAPDSGSCGHCAACLHHPVVKICVSDQSRQTVKAYLGGRSPKIEKRKQWAIPVDQKTKMDPDFMMEDGWVLSEEYQSDIGQAVKAGKYQYGRFSPALVDRSARLLSKELKDSKIDLVMPIPSCNHPFLVLDFAMSLAKKLNLPFVDALDKKQTDTLQKLMENSAFQQKNAMETIEVNAKRKSILQGKRILLVDDMVDSRWTLAVSAYKLRKAGAQSVTPFALVRTGKGD